jgi:diguanylate cyclase (GGDEF)-like protein
MNQAPAASTWSNESSSKQRRSMRTVSSLGDAVLRAVGATLKRSTREPNLTFRFGGEEFLLLMPGLGAAPAFERAEEIRRKIETIRVVHDGRELGPITASLGVASSPEHRRVDRLIQAADAALLRAKRAGRNRVLAAEARFGIQSAA